MWNQEISWKAEPRWKRLSVYCHYFNGENRITTANGNWQTQNNNSQPNRIERETKKKQQNTKHIHLFYTSLNWILKICSLHDYGGIICTCVQVWWTHKHGKAFGIHSNVHCTLYMDPYDSKELFFSFILENRSMWKFYYGFPFCLFFNSIFDRFYCELWAVSTECTVGLRFVCMMRKSVYIFWIFFFLFRLRIRRFR